MLGKLTLEELRESLTLADGLEVEFQGMRDLLSEKPKALELVKTHLFGWGKYYELPVLGQVGLVFRQMGIDGFVVEALRGKSPHAALLELAQREIPDELLNSEDQKRQVLGFIGSLMSLFHNFRAVGHYGKWMNELIEDGSDLAILQAVSIDPVASGTQVIQERMAWAVFVGDEEFLGEYRKALAGPSKKISRQINRVRVAAKVLKDAGAFPMSEKELIGLFCDELHLYPKAGEDPAKALRKIIKLVTPTPTT